MYYNGLLFLLFACFSWWLLSTSSVFSLIFLFTRYLDFGTSIAFVVLGQEVSTIVFSREYNGYTLFMILVTMWYILLWIFDAYICLCYVYTFCVEAFLHRRSLCFVQSRQIWFTLYFVNWGFYVDYLSLDRYSNCSYLLFSFCMILRYGLRNNYFL